MNFGITANEAGVGEVQIFRGLKPLPLIRSTNLKILTND